MENPYSPPQSTIPEDPSRSARSERWSIGAILAICTFPLLIVSLNIVSFLLGRFVLDDDVHFESNDIALRVVVFVTSLSLFIAGVLLFKRRRLAILFFLPFIAMVGYPLVGKPTVVSYVWLGMVTAFMAYAVVLARRGRLR
jgi:hypothetical protein